MAQNLNFNLAVDTNTAVSSINQFFQAFDQGAAKAKGELNKAFGQNLQTNVEINLKNGELVAKKIQNVNQESKRLETAVKAINGQWGKTPNELKRQISILKQLQGNTQKYSQNGKAVTEDWKKVTDQIRRANAALREMTVGGRFDQMKAGLTGIIGKFTLVQTLANAATGVLMGAGRALGDFAGMAGRMETLSLQMEAFTGSAEAADAAFQDFVDIAAKTPFNLEQVAGAGKIMMAFGVDTETAIKATEQLGIVSAATGGDINLLARNLGQIAAQGQAYTRDLTQFAIQGIPIWDQMSMVTGKSVAALKEMAREGQISFDIVSEALNNLTAEGSNFSEIAERMQETFEGRMARIEASVNLLAKEFVATFNKMDKALGGIVSGSMKLFADTLTAIANNMDGISVALGTLTAATAAYFVVANWGNILGAVKLVRGAILAMTTAQNAANVAAAVFAALSGQWANIAAAVVVGGAAYVGLSAAMSAAKQESEELTAGTKDNVEMTGQLNEAQKKLLEEAGLKEMIKDNEDLNTELAKRKDALEAEIEVLEEAKQHVKERYDREIEGIKETIAEDKIKQDEMKQSHQEQLSAINERYDAELSLIDLAIGRLREKTSAEQQLYDFEKRQLESKIASGHLDNEALLRATARLERMNNQEKIAELLKQKAEKQAEKDKEIAAAKKKQTNELEAMKGKIKEQEDEIKNLEAARREEIKTIDDTIRVAEGLTGEIDAANISVNDQIELVQALGSQYLNAKEDAEALGRAISANIAKQKALNAEVARARASASSNSGARASGGPVAGGSTYTVNELGREAFLSASGRLSMINAPSFGDWKAPSSGTVIPAHLTQQLNVPTGGVNLNSAAASNASRAGSGGSMGAMVSALKGAISGGGDTFNQSVTVQAANPVQAANNMMVELTKLKRLRYS